ncbi:N-acetylmuramoyl-L-alanine amidase [Lonsdalea populi]|uniref:N-acetylmuramoyl-L-alanine amidase n=7 Tax=Pectobacteriaceae TaxID=1903410 RepID=UPI000DCA6CF0|nr:N-acetylmuramoyl-L-alanine amidase [Lonsdalea populi]RAT21105.1 N-acetylmuramoyl-L-alanine amidase [Lonsdalea populi]RAT24613.1 N-acetylmuramoyl-L-alanine amidase [Lonsdalea populi]RAT28099.1 N-acetylmuramoyl-L-alanine amidase [Lonsdalea populi]RAT39279.1 N-acetylmuramoyl-L-alanine amidase [Lonsdalea populi]RAT60185.1 N-acetylmuramoyl-L-alanine amidase [Lonsdalea populi]
MRDVLFFGLLALLAGCQAPVTTVPVSIIGNNYRLYTADVSRNQTSRVRLLVIHYTAEDFGNSLRLLMRGEVSAHYLIPEKPPLSAWRPVAWQLVPESQAAWHAGVSYWRGSVQLNSVSVGIELENQGYRCPLLGGCRWAPYSPEQVTLLAHLARDILQRHQIAPQNVVAHSDIAPQRKVDPGPLFPWKQLADAGIGAWPDADRIRLYLGGRAPNEPVSPRLLLDKLARYGYEVSASMTAQQQQRVIAAFQMHFRPRRYDGFADAETEAIVDSLLEKYGGQ